MQIQVRINEKGALRNQRYAFTDRFTLVTELLQICREGDLYIPASEHDQFLDSDLDANRDALADLIRRLRTVDPVQTLESLLQDLRLGSYPLLHGKTVQPTIGVGSAPGHSVELVDGAGASTLADAGGCHAGS